MPTYPVGVDPNNFRTHLPPGAANASSVTYEPAELNYPGDVLPVGDPIVHPELVTLQKGRLLRPVTVTFHDGFQKVFPIDTSVTVSNFTEGYRSRGYDNKIHLNTTEEGEPILVPQEAQTGTGRSRSRRGRRSTRRRSGTRRRRN
jgi:hypothetical protein